MDTRSHSGDVVNWRNYPCNLAILTSHVNAQRYDKRLSKEAERLFVPNEEAQLQLLKIDLMGRELLDPFRNFFKDGWEVDLPFTASDTTLIICICQSYTWSRLLISEEYLRRLFTCLSVHPRFLDVVHLFGEKIAPVEESFAVFFDQLGLDSITYALNPMQHEHRYDIGYSIKYVEEHGRSFPKDPFSIRETGVYQKWSPVRGQSVWVLIQPSASLKEVLEEKFSKVKESDSAEQFKVHGEILIIASENWRQYLNYLEDAFSKMVDVGFYTDVKGPCGEGAIDTDISDVRRLQILTDKFSRLSHVIHLNIEVSIRLQNSVKRIKQLCSLDLLSSYRFDEVESMLELSVFRHRVHKARLDSLLQRANGIASLIRNILDFRTAENSFRIKEAMRDLAKQGLIENGLVKQLAQQSAKDTRFMKIIALITTVFLPATFVASLFGSNFFGFNSSNDGRLLVVASNIWIYVVVTVALLCFTVAGWWWLWQKVRAEIHDEEKLSK